ncbi:hypothetical protein HYQ46_000120 [Verticillium longisporum]|nr:hypothetical protein HYQ46_000120 [Verticillium longisporum]
MKTETASLLLLAALSVAEELTPNDVPLACANMCGPIVELSYKCDVDGTEELRKLKRRKLFSPQQQQQQQQQQQSAPKAKRQADPEPQAPAPVPSSTNNQQAADVIFIPGSIGKFKTIPTPSPPADTGVPSMAVTPAAPAPTPPVLDLRPTTTPTNLNPNLPILATPILPSVPASTPLATTSSTQVPLPVGNDADAGDGVDAGPAPSNSLNGNVGDMVDDAGNLWPGQKGRQAASDLETACICSNRSFNVRRVAGLCGDCLEQVSGDQGPMRAILASCNFTTERYEPEKESLVANVRVEATKPSFTQTAAAAYSWRVSGPMWAVVVGAGMLLGMPS